MWWPRAGSRLRPLRRASSLALASRDVEGLRLYLWTEPTHPQKDQAKVQPPPMLSENPGSLHVGVSFPCPMTHFLHLYNGDGDNN